MIRISSRVLVADNSGALEAECIGVSKRNHRLGALPGSLILITVKKNIFKKNIKKKSRIITKGQLVKSMLICSVKALRRRGSFSIKSSLNAIVLLNQYLLPYGTRMFGPVFREVRQKTNYRKLISLARVLI